MSVADWAIVFGEQGWVNPPPGCEARCGRHYAVLLGTSGDTEVAVWVENHALQLRDATDYYPGGCYEVPLPIILKLMELS